ncbi:MAG: exo-alpha-sialidase, partial [Oscillospiraceae bacterium]|nr:exo-alpha-sialidase [Oscillospiraceae bacterium]
VGRRKEPFGQRAYVSYDGGETWADEYVLRDDGFNGDLGYPATAELPDGSLITVYYQLYDPADEEKRSILSTRWRLER